MGTLRGEASGTSFLGALTGKSQVELDLESVKNSFEAYQRLTPSHPDYELQLMGAKLQTLHERLVELENYDATISQLIHDIADTLRQSATVSINLTKRISELEGELEKNTVYRDWVSDFHRMVAEDVKLSGTLALMRALDREKDKCGGDETKKWKKSVHKKVNQILRENNLDRDDWDRSVIFRRSQNIASHARGILYMGGDWRVVLMDDVSKIDGMAGIAPEDKLMLKKVLEKIPKLYASA